MYNVKNYSEENKNENKWLSLRVLQIQNYFNYIYIDHAYLKINLNHKLFWKRFKIFK